MMYALHHLIFETDSAYLKFEQVHYLEKGYVGPKITNRVAHRVDPDDAAYHEQSHQDWHY